MYIFSYIYINYLCKTTQDTDNIGCFGGKRETRDLGETGRKGNFAVHFYTLFHF